MENRNKYYWLVLLAIAPGVATAQTFRTDSIQKISEVIVTGSNASVHRDKLPFSISIIDAPQLDEANEPRLLDVLSCRVPGLFVTQRNVTGYGVSTGGSGGLKLRGVGGSPTSQLLMMVDGMHQIASVFSHPVNDIYFSAMADRVEVMRGPSSVLYGSNAMGGAINIITRKHLEQGVRNSLGLTYGSYNTMNANLNTSVVNGKWNAMVALNYNQTDGIREDFDFRDLSGLLKIGYKLTDNWRVNADYSLSGFEGSDPSYVSEEFPDPYKQNVVRGMTSFSIDNIHSMTSGSTRFYYSYGNHHIRDPKLFQSLDDCLGIIWFQNFTLVKDNNLTFGAEYNQTGGEIPISGGVEHSEGNRSTMARVKLKEYALYATFSQGFYDNRFTINGGLRFISHDMFGEKLVSQAGMVFKPFETTFLKGAYSRGYRNPSLKELYLYMTANEELKPEVMDNYEASLTQYALDRDLRMEFTVFLSKGKHLIQTVAHPELGHALNENTGRFTNKGFEVALDYRICRQAEITASYSYLDTSLENLTGSPRHQLFASLALIPFKRIMINADVRSISGLYVAQTMADEDFVLLDLQGSLMVNKSFTLFVKAENILDKSYTINYGYEMPGSTLMCGVKLRF